MGFATHAPRMEEGKNALPNAIDSSLRTRGSGLDDIQEKFEMLGTPPAEKPQNNTVPFVLTAKKNWSVDQLNEIKNLPYALPSLIGKANSGPKSASTRRGGKKGAGKRRKGDGVVMAKDGTNWNIYSGNQPATALLRNISNVSIDFVQSYNSGALVTTSTSTPTYGSFAFTIGYLDQVSSLSAVFDQYKIRMLEVWITPVQSAVTGMSTKWASVLDFDDSNNLTAYNQAYDYENVVETTLQDGHYRRFEPHIAVATYSGAFTSYGNIVAPWIDFASTGVLHFGVKVAAQTSTTATPLYLTARYHLSVRNVR